MGRSTNILMILGALLALLGVVGLATPQFSTLQTNDVAQIGDLKVQTQESTSHTIPPLVGGGALALGLILLGGGLYRSRR